MINFFLSIGAWAQSTTPCYIDAFERGMRASGRMGESASVEIELGMNPKIMALLTSDDGTVAPLLEDLALPAWLAKKHPGKSAAEIPWDSLDFPEKLEIMIYVGKEKPERFRKVHGMRIREVVELTFTQPTSFLGKTYPPGTYDFGTSSFLGQVDYRSPDDAIRFTGVEIHFRETATPGQASQDANTFLKALELEPRPQHVHMVAPRALSSDPARKTIQVAQVTDFYRRANLATDMLSIVENRKSLDGVWGDPNFYQSLERADLSTLVRDFFEKAGQPNGAITEKRAQVGIRWGNRFYDEPGLWGIEYRAVPTNADPKRMAEILDGIHGSMKDPAFGLPEPTIETWLRNQPGWDANPLLAPQMVEFAVSESHFNHRGIALVDLAKSSPPKIRDLAQTVTHEWARKLAAGGTDMAKTHPEVRMLLFDWSKDPLVASVPGLAQKIEERQLYALRKLSRNTTQNGADVVNTVRQFLVDSELYERTLKSVGIPPKP
ncbi:MAG: hypothetical protein AB7F66_09970 [Bacteriovoracia bacterium]